MGRPLPDHHSTDNLTDDQSSVSDAESDDSEISSHTGMYAEMKTLYITYFHNNVSLHRP